MTDADYADYVDYANYAGKFDTDLHQFLTVETSGYADKLEIRIYQAC